ncbi:MAG: hypothetical protein V7629_09140 [Motiliproteus sp.]
MYISEVISNTARIPTVTPAMEFIELDAARRERAKASYNTRRVDVARATQLLTGDVCPQAGDLVLARVEKIGQHARIERPDGRRASLFHGDEIIVCYGARYAPDQFESYLPTDLGPCHLVAAGGVASLSVNRHKRMKAPTAIQPLGLLTDADGGRINLKDWGLPKAPVSTRRPLTIAVVGTAMNAGKTTVAASLVRGLKRAGQRVGAAKITGTGAGGDRWALLDSGADSVYDFTDTGVPSTFGLEPQQIQTIFSQLTHHLAIEGVDVVVLEIADGLYQTETAALLASPLFAAGVDHLLFAASDALGAKAGVEHLAQLGLQTSAVSGVLTSSPLASREAAQVLDVPVVETRALTRASWLAEHLAEADRVEVIPAQPASLSYAVSSSWV